MPGLVPSIYVDGRVDPGHADLSCGFQIVMERTRRKMARGDITER
jgi:hypothetical protein